MHIALCQFEPKWGQVDENMRTVDRLLSKYQPGDFDILVLPEMIFTGYVFRSREEILPFCEQVQGVGFSDRYLHTALSCVPLILLHPAHSEIASRYRAFVAVGFPERRSAGSNGTDPDLYNSMLLVDRAGALLHVYAKHFLYETDKIWAREGPCFESIVVPELGQVGFGICMDLNPHEFEAPFDAFEFATFHKKAQSQLLLCPMNWLTHDRRVHSMRDPKHSEKETKAVEATLQYWICRLTPLVGSKVVVAISNRTGQERDSMFTGSSCVLDLSRKPAVQHWMDRVEEGVTVLKL